MRITRWGEYGILCCMYLARRHADGEAVGASEIAEQQSIPTQYAQQILHRLRKGGVIKSVRGPRGGFLLSRSAEEINLREILQAAEGHTFELICETDPIYPSVCNVDTAAAAENSTATESTIEAATPVGCEPACGLKDVWQELQQAVNTLLESKTLAALVAHDKNIPRAGLAHSNGNFATSNGLVPGPKNVRPSKKAFEDTKLS